MACVEHAVFFFLHENLRIQSITYLRGPIGSLEITRVNPVINCFQSTQRKYAAIFYAECSL